MPRTSSRRLGGALLVLALVLLVVAVLSDLLSSDSILRSYRDGLFPRQTPGERLRDDVIREMERRR